MLTWRLLRRHADLALLLVALLLPALSAAAQLGLGWEYDPPVQGFDLWACTAQPGEAACAPTAAQAVRLPAAARDYWEPVTPTATRCFQVRALTVAGPSGWERVCAAPPPAVIPPPQPAPSPVAVARPPVQTPGQPPGPAVVEETAPRDPCQAQLDRLFACDPNGPLAGECLDRLILALRCHQAQGTGTPP